VQESEPIHALTVEPIGGPYAEPFQPPLNTFPEPLKAFPDTAKSSRRWPVGGVVGHVQLACRVPRVGQFTLALDSLAMLSKVTSAESAQSPGPQRLDWRHQQQQAAPVEMASARSHLLTDPLEVYRFRF
jgi:hypothetical protein